MKNLISHALSLTLFLVVFIVACNDSEPTPNPDEPTPTVEDNFDRGLLLSQWADNMIIPAHQAFNTSTHTLHSQIETFVNDPTASNFDAVQMAWQESYIAWQKVPFYILGRGEDDDVLIDFYTNLYPTKVKDKNIRDLASLDLTLSSNQAKQGYPAIDYMLYGIADTEEDILALYASDAQANQYRQFLVKLADRLKTLSDAVYTDWTNGYRDKFVANDGKSANAAVNAIVNDFVRSYEFDIRTSKVGLPSGNCPSDCGEVAKDPSQLEALYRRNLSKTLLLQALDAAQDFYNGVPHNGSFDDRGTSLYDYMDYLQTERDGEKVSDLINTQFDRSRTEINKLDEDLVSQIENDNAQMTKVYDELQLNVLFLKTYMMDAMGIAQDYFSSDGD